MEDKTALLIGATGLVGAQLLAMLLDTPTYKQITVFVRRSTGVKHTKLKELVVNFDQLAKYQSDMAVDDVFCCLGTTIKKAGSREVMYQIDVEYPLEVAKLSHQMGANHYLLVSSMNANPSAKIWYSKMKGELEQKLQQIPFSAISIARPSLLMGERAEFRFGEHTASILYRLLSFLFVGPLEKMKAIEGRQVAKALLAIAQAPRTGAQVYPSIDLQYIERVLQG